jgi:large subunit ribosomal protein L22
MEKTENEKIGKKKTETKESENKTDVSREVSKEVRKSANKESSTKKKIVKDFAIANGYSLKISPKYSIFVCRVLRGKSPENAIKRLEDVVAMKRAIPMSSLEVGHKKGKGMSGGKYPRNVCIAIIEIIKQVGANAIVNEIEDPIIVIAKSNQASAPQRRGGRKAKRTHIYLEIRSKKTFLLQNQKTKFGKHQLEIKK